MKIALDKGKGGVKVINVEGGREKEKEIIVRHETAPSRWKTWKHDHLLPHWNKNYSVW